MSQEITELLRQAGAGESAAMDRLLPLIYGELRGLARAQQARAPATLLDTTALVHEAYLRLVDQENLAWPDRRHFFAYAARAMRSILVDNARRRAAAKHGGDQQRDDDALEFAPSAAAGAADLLLVDQALDRLAGISDRLREVVEMHVFGGLEFKDIAACLQVTERTVFRDWRKARALLEGLLGVAHA
jgi:RNA polymerase sigma factor (TIGR02999 family)